MSESQGPCQATVVGIQVHYCVGNKREVVWLDLDKVKALTWCVDDSIPAKAPHTGGGGTVPTTSGGAKNCPKPLNEEEAQTTLCWWDGKDWVCGVL